MNNLFIDNSFLRAIFNIVIITLHFFNIIMLTYSKNLFFIIIRSFNSRQILKKKEQMNHI